MSKIVVVLLILGILAIVGGLIYYYFFRDTEETDVPVEHYQLKKVKSRFRPSETISHIMSHTRPFRDDNANKTEGIRDSFYGTEMAQNKPDFDQVLQVHQEQMSMKHQEFNWSDEN